MTWCAKQDSCPVLLAAPRMAFWCFGLNTESGMKAYAVVAAKRRIQGELKEGEVRK